MDLNGFTCLIFSSFSGPMWTIASSTYVYYTTIIVKGLSINDITTFLLLMLPLYYIHASSKFPQFWPLPSPWESLGTKVFPGSRNLAPVSCVVIVSRLTLLLWPFWYQSCNTLLVYKLYLLINSQNVILMLYYN